ncbi:MAG: PKD domain-containing protein, partial [Thermoplasmata archaeon]|nr:PKD domain-containing protein [Thermoplasmata archaeon]
FIDDGSVELTGETVDYEFTEPGVYTVTLTVADAAGLEDIDTVVITMVDEAPPVANAGADLTGVEVGDTVMLNGSGSTDNVGIDEYVWTFVDGTAQELSGRTVNYTFDNVGVFTITLTVTDAAGFSDTDVVVVSVSLANDPPVADAGEDQNVKVDATVTLDASGSTDDNAIVTYTWTFDYDGEPVILTGVEQEFVFEIAGTYNVTLTVTDAQGLSDTDTVEIVVESSAMSFIADYWWAFAVIAAAVVIGVAAALMSRGKGGKGKASPPTENEIADEFDDDDLPPPDDEL